MHAVDGGKLRVTQQQGLTGTLPPQLAGEGDAEHRVTEEDLEVKFMNQSKKTNPVSR